LDRAICLGEAAGGGALLLFEMPTGPHHPVACVSRPGSGADLAQWNGDWLRSQASIRELYGSCGPVRIDESLRPELARGSDTLGDTAPAVLIPLLEGRRQVAGFLQLSSLQRGGFTDERVRRVLSMAIQVVPAINRALLLDNLRTTGLDESLVGTSPALVKLERELKNLARFCDEPVMIRGERGTGKDLLARALHCWSRRRGGPFVPVLASALTETLIADDLFGHEKHAYTGAETLRAGRFQAAEGGCLFLDEVGDLPLTIQSVLLRVLERGELSRIGRDLPLRVNVRVFSATNRDLDQLMAQGSFRRDLFDRLGLLCLEVPPLRDRKEDIPRLVAFFLRNLCSRFERQTLMGRETDCSRCDPRSAVQCVRPEFFEALLQYDWPGNVRELKHAVTSIVARSPDDVLRFADLPAKIRSSVSAERTFTSGARTLDDVVRTHIERVLTLTNQNQTSAAKILGVPLSTMRHKMKRLHVSAKPGR